MTDLEKALIRIEAGRRLEIPLTEIVAGVRSLIEPSPAEPEVKP